MTRPDPPEPDDPWTRVPPEDYEAHMGPEGADQLRPLSAELGRALAELRPARLLVLGVATGNGLEHVDPAVTRRVVGVDVNASFLERARRRHELLGPRLELHCADAARVDLEPGAFDLVWAGIFFEHVDPPRLVPRVAAWLAPGGWLVIASQRQGAAGPVTPSRFASIQALAATMRIADLAALDALLSGQGLVPGPARLVAMAHGKTLHVARWRRPG